MIVCSCNVLSDRQIRSAVTETEAAVRTVGQVYRCLGCSAQCGRCARTIRKLLDDVKASGCDSCPMECPVSAQAPGHPGPVHPGPVQASQVSGGHAPAEASPSPFARQEQAPRRHGRRTHGHGNHAYAEHGRNEHGRGDHARPHPAPEAALVLAAE